MTPSRLLPPHAHTGSLFAGIAPALVGISGTRGDIPGTRKDIPGTRRVTRGDMPGTRGDMPGTRGDIPGTREDTEMNYSVKNCIVQYRNELFSKELHCPVQK